MDILFGLLSAVVVSATVYWWVIPAAWRSTFLLLISVGFIGAFSPGTAVLVLVEVAVGFTIARHLNAHEENRKPIVRACMVALIGSLCFYKYLCPWINENLGDLGPVLPLGIVPSLVLPLGFSYVTFRLIHSILEAGRGKFPECTFAEFGSYILFFPTYVAGPIERFKKFHRQTRKRAAISAEDVGWGTKRVIYGVTKKVVLADPILPLAMPILAAPADHGWWAVLLSVYGLALFFYLDFSGYSDIAIGVSRLFGYKVMENFNHPYFRTNIANYWRNWHISLYNFIRDYFFYPLVARKPNQLKTFSGVVATMLLFMLWHEGTWSWFLLGLYHGGALVVWQLFQEAKRQRPKLRKAIDNKKLDPMWCIITFNFVAMGHLLVYYSVPHTVSIWLELLP